MDDGLGRVVSFTGPHASLLPMHLQYAIVFVSDMTRLVAFYRDVIGAAVRFESPHWSEFETGGATLALHLSDAAAVASRDPQASPAGFCKPGFGVADLDAFHRRMSEHGVQCLQPPKDTFGTRLAQYTDPDGLPFSVSEDRKPR